MAELPVLEPRAAYALWAKHYPGHAHNPMMRTEERTMLALLPANLRGLKVLDAGCGSGRYLTHALRRGACAVLGADLSVEMLLQTQQEILELPGKDRFDSQTVGLLQASIEALPLQSGWADVTVCGLTLGHLPHLDAPLAELRRVTRPGGMVLCSELHPIGQIRGWQRNFKADGKRFAVRHHWRTLDEWKAACGRVGLSIVEVLEPHLEPADIPAGAQFDSGALALPVAVVFQLRRGEITA